MQTPAPFGYERATSLDGAIAALQRLGSEARVIAGGHSLLPMMKLRLANPEHLVDINNIPDLDYIEERDGEIRIGALTRHVDLLKSDLLFERYPVFRDAETVIADPVVRNRGTIGGSLCQADAAEDLSSVCAAAKADVVIRGADGERVVSMEDFHVGPYMTAVGAGEILTEIRLKVQPGAGSAHEKVERRAGDWAIAAASACVWMDGGTFADVGIALSAVGLTTIHLTRAEELLRGKAPFVRAVHRSRRDRFGRLFSDGRRPRTCRLQAPPRRRAHRPSAPARHRTRAERGGLRHGSHDDRQRGAGHARRGAASAARALHPRDARPHRHPLGLRHLQLRRVRGPDGRQARQVVHDARRDVRRPRHPHRRVARGRRTSSTRSSRDSTSCTRSSAASARRGC